MNDIALDRAEIPDGIWTWWQARRLRYNIGLAAAGVLAYALTVALHFAFGDLVWTTWAEALGMTLFLGTLYLLVMAIANICYLLGPFGEAWLKPADPERFRKTAFAMGFWGSVALPFLFTLLNLSMLLAEFD